MTIEQQVEDAIKYGFSSSYAVSKLSQSNANIQSKEQASWFTFGPVAQQLERHSYKVWVVGAIPTGPTKTSSICDA